MIRDNPIIGGEVEKVRGYMTGSIEEKLAVATIAALAVGGFVGIAVLMWVML